MKHQFNALVREDAKWFTAFCPEIPEGNGQGKTREKALKDLATSIADIMAYRLDTALSEAPRGTECTAVVV